MASSSDLNPTIGRLRLNRTGPNRTGLNRMTPRVLSAASAMALGAAALPAYAQQAPAPAQLPTISVEGQRPAENYKVEESASPKFTAPLLDTPRSVTVIPQEVIQERGATTLLEVLRTTPGVTLGAGEGGNPIGDRPFIRGFDALTDTYIDGIRDTGALSRESFNLEQIEIIKGASSAYGGRGATGGSLNLVSKTAKATDFNTGSVTLGTDLTKRATADVNHVIDNNVAFRLNAMFHDAEVAGRDDVEVQRFGFAPTVTFGLNKPTRLTLSYYHLETDDTPDYGHPFDPRTGKPVSVDRDNFYGLTSRDFRETYYDGVTAQIEHDLSGNATLRNTTRYSYSENKYIVTKPNATVAQLLAGEMSRESRSRNADTETIANVTDVTGNVDIGGFRNAYVVGLELSREQTRNRGFALDPATLTGVSLNNPNSGDTYSGTIGPAAGFTHSDTDTQAVYVLDTIELNPQWSVNLGLRYDRYDSQVTNATDSLSSDTDFLNYQAGIVYKPAPNGSIYVAYSTSSTPPGYGAGQGGTDANLSISNQDLEPEENRSYEIGTKWDVLDNKLSLTGAVFRTEKTNARITVADVTQNIGEQRVDGFEVGFAGNLTPAWKIFGGYTYLNSELVDDGPVALNEGKDFPGIAPHNISLWSTYDLTSDWTIGGGAVYMARRFVNADNSRKVPDYWRFDAMAAYKLSQSVDLQLNIQNIFDETIYDGSHNGQFATIAPGRVALLTTNFKF